MMQTTRTYALAIYSILKEYSDSEHIISTPKIIELLDTIFHINLDNRTVRSNIEALVDFGIDIEGYNDNRKGYYLRERDFEDSEIQLLCNSVHSAHYIPEKFSNEIIKKLSSKQSKYKRKEFSDFVYIQNSKKTENKELFLNLELLMKAIIDKNVVEFSYLHYNYYKKLVRKREKPYLIHPYYIVQENDNLYLICKNDKYENLSHYRIDKMKDIKITKHSVSSLKKTFDPYVYARTKKFMYSGEDERITLHCHKRMLDDLIDQFGTEIKIIKDVHNSDYFHAVINSTQQGMFYFALQYLEFCEVLEPISLREKLKLTLNEKVVKYSREIKQMKNISSF